MDSLTPSEVSQKEKDKHHMISLTCGAYNMAQMITYKTETDHGHGGQTCVCQGSGEGGAEWGAWGW